MIRRGEDARIETREKMRGGDGAVSIQHYFEKDEIAANVRLCAKLLLPPGSGIGLHEHGQEDEIFVIQKGHGIIGDGTREWDVKAGDAILTGNGESHTIRNAGPEDLEVTAVIVCYGMKE